MESVLESITKPVAMIGIAEKGYATIKLSVSGPGGHSSLPESGRLLFIQAHIPKVHLV